MLQAPSSNLRSTGQTIMSVKIKQFLAERWRQTPFLALDLDLVVERYRLLKEALPAVDIHYAVKANPADEIIAALHREGSYFDVASTAELDGCTKLNIPAARMSYGHTIKKECRFSGNGIHTGCFTNMSLLPAKENTGIVFVRKDLNNIRIQADVNNVISTERSTNLAKGNVEVRTVEHILAAISGNNIDNLIIEIDNIEIPILDGSSYEFSEKIKKAGIVGQKSIKKYYKLKRKISYNDPISGTEIHAIPYDGFKIDVTIDYDSKTLGKQKYTLEVV